MRCTLVIIGLIILFSLSAQAQTFSSGSTGADGPLDLSSGSLNLQLPESGVFNFTTVNIPSGRVLTFKRNFRNTPVIMLAQGNVVVAGSIALYDSIFLTMTTGGFNGGAVAQPGFGPGGGQPSPGDTNGKWVGPLSLVPIIGGSGAANSGSNGGGAIVIASSTSITVSGNINANGGFSVSPFGSGGAVRLVANSVTISGGITAISNAGSAYHGVIRAEAPPGALTFTGTSNPVAILSTINPQIIADSTTPSLAITSIGGFAVPSYSGSVPGRVDLLLPTTLADPINLVVQASNIPVGTQVRMNISGSTGATYTPGNLSGTLASSTATLGISGLNRTVSVASYMFVYAQFDLPPSGPTSNPSGPDHVTQVRIEAGPATKPRFVFLRSDGSEVEPAKVPQSLRAQFGQ